MKSEQKYLYWALKTAGEDVSWYSLEDDEMLDKMTEALKRIYNGERLYSEDEARRILRGAVYDAQCGYGAGDLLVSDYV